MKENIILIGFMGSGKSSVGKILAEKLSRAFYDMDNIITEKLNTSISLIFKEHGEEYFRKQETLLLQDLNKNMNESVLSTGGGVIVKEENTPLLRAMGKVVYLKTSADSIVERLKDDKTRPLLRGDNKEREINKILQKRKALYEGAAHQTIETDGKTVDEIVESILEGAG